jgi:GTP-binding protein
MNGSGTGELLDELVSILPEKKATDPELPRFAIIGQPNVGKSSLFNLLLGEERTIVTPVAGTTRDTIHTRYTGYGFDFFLVDTAGLRKKANVREDLEFYSVMRTVRAIEDCDVGLLLIDATQGMNMQDINIFRLLERNKKGVVILVNKWDLAEKDTHHADDYTKAIRKKLEPFTDVPVVFTSVLNKQRVHKALKIATEVFRNRSQKISTSLLNKKMLPHIEYYPPPSYKGKSVSIKYITQLSGSFPQFAFFCNLPQYIRDPYKRYLENKLREEFELTGVPVAIFFRKKN